MCGDNDSGQLGIGFRGKQAYPNKVDLPGVLEISCGIAHTLFLTEHGLVYSTGSNKFGQLGLQNKKNSSVPMIVSSLDMEFVTQISCSHHSGALTDNGDLYIWGTGCFGEFLKPVNFFENKARICQFQIGGLYGVAIDEKGGLWSWGNNTNGILG